jgi:hypothetical protein
MVAYLVDETDERIRLSMDKYLLLGEKSSYCPLVVDDYHVKRGLGIYGPPDGNTSAVTQIAWIT